MYVANKVDDFITYAGIVNGECERFNELTPDLFNCLIFAYGLTTKNDAEICKRILTKVEQNQKLTRQEISKECQKIVNRRHDAE